jgi:AcrR family transcriptional regulator
MARPRAYSDEQILSAVRDLLLAEGPRGVTTAAVSARSGAPVGSLYHRFPSRSAMVAQLWIRTIRELHQFIIAAAEQAEPGMDRALTVALATIDFAAERPEDARLLAMASREELRSSEGLTADLAEALEDLNAPAQALAAQLARELYGRAGRAAVDRVVFAVFGIPYTAVRHRHPPDRDLTPMREPVRAACRAALEVGGTRC